MPTITPKRPLRLIQVGLGGFGRNWYQTKIAPFTRVATTGFVDSSDEAMQIAQRTLGIDPADCFATLDDAMRERECDAVVITASLPGHVPNALTALHAGKHVLMEKPFAPSVAEARAVVRAASDAERTLMISQNYRFFPAPILAARIVSEERLGRLGVVHVDFRRDHVAFSEGRKRHYQLPHPLLADMAIHHFDLMRMVAATDARRVRCHSFQPPWSHYNDAPAAEAVIEMESGVVVTYRGSWVSPGSVTPWAGEWHLEFERGEVWFASRGDDTPGADEVWIRRVGKEPKRQALPAMRYVDRSGSLNEFVNAIRDGREPVSSGNANIGSIALTYAAIAATESGDWESVER
ncbi:MAG: gfo/Idh/MocA family oxidoreductase [Spirochaetaceae bacterium]|nr:MAG: gfo/Idh/MocA family oxidoreductase [Spirochaetaceae bacterium]